MRLPSIRQLSFFVALVEHQSFSRAADSVHVTQPALSTSIKDLEELLGNALVIRTPKMITPTPIGELVYTRAKQILNDCTDLVAEGSRGVESLAGKFSLGIIPTIAPFLLPRIFAPLKAAFPDLNLSVRESQTDTLIEDINARKLDAAIIALPWETHYLAHETIFDEALFALIPATHALAKKDKITSRDIVADDLLMLEKGHCLRDHTLAACRLSDTMPMGLSASSLATLLHMVAGGFGVTLLPEMARTMAQGFAPQTVIKPFNPARVGRKIALVWREASPKTDDCTAFASFLKDLTQ